MTIKESSVGTDCALGFSTVTNNDVRMNELLKIQNMCLHRVRRKDAVKMKVWIAGGTCSATILGNSLHSMSLCSSLVLCMDLFIFFNGST